jgi:hypothetical protein
MTSIFRLSLSILVLSGGVAENAASQPAPCGTVDPVVDRIYVVLSSQAELESDQLMAAVSSQRPVPMVRDASRGRWFVDVRPPLLTPVTLSKAAVSLSKVGWKFDPREQPLVETETVGKTTMCTMTVAFDAVRTWRVRVMAESNAAPVSVAIACERGGCAVNSRTEFLSEWLTVNERLVMQARFAFACSARIEVSEYTAETSIVRSRLLRLLPTDCHNNKAQRLGRLFAELPDRISVRLSPR